MRIGILTQPLQTNYGGLIQNYALQKALRNLGHNPITLDQKELKLPAWYRFLGGLKEYVLCVFSPKHFQKPKYTLSADEERIIRKNCNSFVEKYISHSRKCAGSKDFLEEAKRLGIEGFVVGSDQCWRPCYNMYIGDMFLSFCKDDKAIKKRVAYAASFGSDTWEFSEKETISCSHLVRMFDAITVREDSAVGLCKQYLKVDATHVVDPTLLLTKNDYISLIKENEEPISTGELFNYVLDPSTEMSFFISKVEKETGYKSFQVLPKCNADHLKKKDVKHHIEDCIYPSPIAWLRAFMDARMTIVDSFHGTVFSIIFNKPFWVLGNKERGLSRFVSLLSMFGLEDRLITANDFDKIDIKKGIDWSRVNSVLEAKRYESLNILKHNLEKNDKDFDI